MYMPLKTTKVVTAAHELMLQLHLYSDEFIMPVCPNHPFPADTTERPCNNRTDSQAS